MTEFEAGTSGRRVPHRTTANFLGDIVRAREVLRISDAVTSAAVADLLGLGGTSRSEPRPPGRTPHPEPVSTTGLSHEPAPADDRPQAAPSLSADSDEDESVRSQAGGPAGGPAEESALPTRRSKWSKVTIKGVAAGLPDWWDVEVTFPDAVDGVEGAGRRLGFAVPGGRGAVPAVVPDVPTLFRPRVARHILSAALSVPVAEGDVDVESVTDMVAARRSVTAIPRKRLFTTRFGAQVLIDVGPGMQPYRTDVARLPRILASIIGPGLEVLRFDTFPLDGAGPRGRPWPAYRPPPAGTPVLVVTGFGIGGKEAPPPASPPEWADFVRQLRRPCARPLALVPCPVDRVDPGLLEIMTVIPWERTATVGAVRESAWWAPGE